jgi:lipid A 3-O-deacylase
MHREAILRSCALALLASWVAIPADARGETGVLSIGAGCVDVVRKRDPSPQMVLEYRTGGRAHPLQVVLVATMTRESSAFLGMGLEFELALGRHLKLPPSFAPGYYYQGNGMDLGASLEFRSQLELGFGFRSGQRLSVNFGHLSNAGVGRINPGLESLTLAWQLPLTRRRAH